MSETREGPGWWMAPDGGWNPPEMWPEATPPLPGWVRQANGRWAPPGATSGAGDSAESVVAPAHSAGIVASPEQIIDLSDSAIARGHVPQHGVPQHSAGPRGRAPAAGAVPPADRASLQGHGPKHRLGLGFGTTEAQPHQVIREVEDRGMTRRRLFLLAVAAIAGAIAGLVLVLVLL